MTSQALFQSCIISQMHESYFMKLQLVPDDNLPKNLKWQTRHKNTIYIHLSFIWKDLNHLKFIFLLLFSMCLTFFFYHGRIISTELPTWRVSIAHDRWRINSYTGIKGQLNSHSKCTVFIDFYQKSTKEHI